MRVMYRPTDNIKILDDIWLFKLIKISWSIILVMYRPTDNIKFLDDILLFKPIVSRYLCYIF